MTQFPFPCTIRAFLWVKIILFEMKKLAKEKVTKVVLNLKLRISEKGLTIEQQITSIKFPRILRVVGERKKNY